MTGHIHPFGVKLYELLCHIFYGRAHPCAGLVPFAAAESVFRITLHMETSLRTAFLSARFPLTPDPIRCQSIRCFDWFPPVISSYTFDHSEWYGWNCTFLSAIGFSFLTADFCHSPSCGHLPERTGRRVLRSATDCQYLPCLRVFAISATLLCRRFKL